MFTLFKSGVLSWWDTMKWTHHQCRTAWYHFADDGMAYSYGG